MYRLTTDTGVSFEAGSPIDIGQALHAELTAHCAEQVISYSITLDGTRQHDGTIEIHNTKHDSSDFIWESVEELVNDMIIDGAYAAHAQAKRI